MTVDLADQEIIFVDRGLAKQQLGDRLNEPLRVGNPAALVHRFPGLDIGSVDRSRFLASAHIVTQSDAACSNEFKATSIGVKKSKGAGDRAATNRD